jgi:hypothetical protein
MTAPHAQPDDQQEELPLSLTVRFAPDNLPSGAVDAQDMVDFLEGMQLVLDGKMRYDRQAGLHTRFSSQDYRFTIIGYQAGSLAVTIALGGILALLGKKLVQAVGGKVMNAAGQLLKEVIKDAAKKYAEEFAGELAHVHADAVGNASVEELRHVLKEYQDLLHQTTKVEHPELPPQLVNEVGDGLKKIAVVASKKEYQSQGIMVLDDVNSDRVVILNAGSLRQIDRLLQSASNAGEFVVVEGIIKESSHLTRSFLLEQPGHSKTNRYVRCVYNRNFEDRTLEDQIGDFHAKRSYVQVRGVWRIDKKLRRRKPYTVVQVGEISLAKPPATLWDGEVSIGNRAFRSEHTL